MEWLNNNTIRFWHRQCVETHNAVYPMLLINIKWIGTNLCTNNPDNSHYAVSSINSWDSENHH
jgi:hypothetical protein